MIEYKKQQIDKNYKIKMEILVKVVLITILSSFFALLFFDYQNTQYQLALSSKENCLDITPSHNTLICNSCFKIAKQNKLKEQIRIESQHPFMIVGLDQTLQKSGLTCSEWLQTMNYESQISRQSAYQNNLKIQPFVLLYLRSMQKQHNQILSIQKSQQDYDQKHKVVQKLTHQNLIAFYYSQSKGTQPLQIFYSNLANKELGIHIVSLLTIAAVIAIFYVFHYQNNKSCLTKYKQNVFSIMFIFGTFIWILVSNIEQHYALFLVFCKVMFFSLVFANIFEAGRWLFFGIICLLNFVAIQLSQLNGLLQKDLQIILLFIVFIQLNHLTKNQNFYFSKNSNKKIYLATVTLLVVISSLLQFYFRNTLFGYLGGFLVQFLCLVSCLMSIKNMDIDDYTKLFKKQNEGESNQLSFDTLDTSKTLEQSEEDFSHQLKVVKK